MRTTLFRDVYHGVLTRHGLDPDGAAIRYDTARAIGRHINKRVRTAWQSWPWPELLVTEERAFRTIWSSTKTFFRVGANGKPDELAYIPTWTTQPYYRVKKDAAGDPPAGTLPTNTTYFEPLIVTDSYVALDQVCLRTIGVVFGVYTGNPSLNGCGTRGLPYRPGEKGIEVHGCHGASVFIKYQLPPPRFSLVPYAPGKAYVASDVVYNPLDGHCYLAVAASTNIAPTDTNYWRRVDFPQVLEQYVVAAAYADGLKESDPADDANKRQLRIAEARLAEAEAEEHLRREIDLLFTQGEKYSYYKRRPYCYYPLGYCCSQPWDGVTVTTLTEICETDPTWPPIPSAIAVKWEYHPEIVSLLTAGGAPALQGLPTAGIYAVGSRVEISIVVSGSEEAQTWILRSGGASGSDVAPADYHATTNNVHWEKVG